MTSENDASSKNSSQPQNGGQGNVSGKPGENGQKKAAPAEEKKLFSVLSPAAPLVLLLLLAAQAWPDFWQAFQGNALYCPAETHNIKVFQQTSLQGSLLAPGNADGAQWPAFACLMAALGHLTQLGAPSWLPYPLMGALTAFLALLGAWGLALAAGFGHKAAFATGLVLLSSPLFIPLSHFFGPPALSSGLLLLSLVFLCRGWQKERAWGNLASGFLLAGMAGLSGGFFHLFLPLLASIVFLLWLCAFRRAQSLDALFAFLLLAVGIGSWYCGIIMIEANDYGLQLFSAPLRSPWPLPERWWLPALAASAGLLPWICVVFFASWRRILTSAWTDLKASRKERSGSAFVWISLFSGTLLTPIVPEPQAPAAAVCLTCLAAPLLGKAVLKLPPLGCRLLCLVSILLLLAGGGMLGALGFTFSQDLLAGWLPVQATPRQREILLSLNALPIIAMFFLLAAMVTLRFLKSRQPHNFLLHAAVLAALLTQPTSLLLVPELASVPELRLSRLQDILPAGGSLPTAPPAMRDQKDAPSRPDAGGHGADASEQPLLPDGEKPETAPDRIKTL